MELKRVVATDAALQLIAQLQARYGALMFHQSGGCCDGSSPMCYPEKELTVGASDVLLGEIGGAQFYMSSGQFEYWHRAGDAPAMRSALPLCPVDQPLILQDRAFVVGE